MKTTKLALILAGTFLVAGAANAATATFSPSQTASGPANSPMSALTLRLGATVNTAVDVSNIQYAAPTPDKVSSSHVAGAVAQFVAITVPSTTKTAKLTNTDVTGANAEHARVGFMANSSTGPTGDNIFVANGSGAADGTETIYVGLAAKDAVNWTGGSTVATPVVTFYNN